MRVGLDKKIAKIVVGFVTFALIVAISFYFNKGFAGFWGNFVKHPTNTASLPPVEKSTESTKQITPPPVVQDKTKAKEAISKAPPKYSGKSTTQTTDNPDGSKITKFSDSSIAKNIDCSPRSDQSVDSIAFDDETGQYPWLNGSLKDYLSGTLLKGSEVGSLCQIIVENAGDTGWEGQYVGSYYQKPNGDITSESGYIVLNNYYHKDSPQFADYMKLVLSHEYGHHYTLYHKWVDLDSPFGTRFPDSYYTTRPLSKAATATDYSKGWGNCEVEIIAEDYSYLYSGYGLHAMSGTYGFPSAATKTWLTNFYLGGTNQAVSDITPPQVSILGPANGSTLSGSVTFSASASDNVGVNKVSFYVNNNLISEDTTSPYESSLNTQAYQNGSYTLKAVASDCRQTAESTVSVNFNNASVDTEKPTINFLPPLNSTYSWSGDIQNLLIQIRSTDNIGVSKIKIFINDVLVGESGSANVDASWPFTSSPAGTYILKAQALDAAGNIGETSVTITKS